MSSFSLVIVHASLKNMVSRKTRLKFLVSKHEVEHDEHDDICNRIMMKKKYRFLDPFTGEAPLKMNNVR